MELADHLRRAGRWSWLMVVLPVLCAVVALLFLPPAKPLWTSEATVVSPPTVTGRNGSQYVNDFQAALLSSVVAEDVAAQTDVTAAEALNGLTSQPLAPGSSLLEVSFTSEDEQAAGEVPRLAARAALQTLIQPQVDAGQAQLAIAREQYDTALRAREAFTDEIGIQLPAQAYQSGLAELSSLRNSAEVARLEERASASGLLRQLEKRTGEVAALAPQAVAYDLLQNDVERTYNELNRLRFSLTATEAQLAATGEPGTVTPGEVRSVSTSTQSARPVLTAAVAGLVIAALVIAGMLLLSNRRGRTQQSSPSEGTPDPVTSQGGPVSRARRPRAASAAPVVGGREDESPRVPGLERASDEEHEGPGIHSAAGGGDRRA